MARTDTRSYTRRFTLALTLLAALAGARTAAAGTLTLMWDANSEPEVNGYLVYIGTQPGVYMQAVDVSGTSYVFPNAVPGRRYYFAVAAHTDSLVSELSVEVSGLVPGSGNTPPTLGNPGAITTNVGQNVLLVLQGADADGDSLVYSAFGLPAGLQLAAGTGRITGTPTVASFYAVTATVSDGTAAASQSFLWTIRPGTGTSAPQHEDPLVSRHASSDALYTGTVPAVRPPAPPPATTRTVQRMPATGAGAVGPSGSAGTTPGATGRSAVTRSVAGQTTSATALRHPEGGDSVTGGLIIGSGPVVRSVAGGAEAGDTRTVVDSEPASDGEAEPVLTTSALRERVPAVVTAPMQAPTVAIETPVSQATFAAGTTVIFSGIAQDAGDGNLAARIVWTSSLDGAIGTGAVVARTLSAGTHTIVATVTNSKGNTRSAQVTIVVR